MFIKITPRFCLSCLLPFSSLIFCIPICGCLLDSCVILWMYIAVLILFLKWVMCLDLCTVLGVLLGSSQEEPPVTRRFAGMGLLVQHPRVVNDRGAFLGVVTVVSL